MNSVFRLNKFKPGDAKFDNHLDTPYYDSSRSQISLYTLLIYLTKGHADPALRVSEEALLNSIDAMSFVIFRQDYQHEGMAFVDSEKIFLRSELIFEVRKLEHNPKIGGLFSQAVYFTGESLFNSDYHEIAHQLYERANLMHWGGTSAFDSPLIHKRFDQTVDFVTNGLDYWFSSRSGSLKQSAMIAVLDYFNCKLPTLGFFRSKCETKQLDDLKYGVDVHSRVLKFLRDLIIDTQKKQLDQFFTPTNEKLKHSTFSVFDDDKYDIPTAKEDWQCCPYHTYHDECGTNQFISWKCENTVALYLKCESYTRKKIENVPLIFLGEEILFDESTIVVDADKIYFSEGLNRFPDRINFVSTLFRKSSRIQILLIFIGFFLSKAACWNDESVPLEYINKENESISAPRFLLPPICFTSFNEGYHFRVDFFNNDWQASDFSSSHKKFSHICTQICLKDSREIPVPCLFETYDDRTKDKYPFFEALNGTKKREWSRDDWYTQTKVHSAYSDGDDSDDETGWHRCIESDDEDWDFKALRKSRKPINAARCAKSAKK